MSYGWGRWWWFVMGCGLWVDWMVVVFYGWYGWLVEVEVGLMVVLVCYGCRWFYVREGKGGGGGFRWLLVGGGWRYGG